MSRQEISRLWWSAIEKSEKLRDEQIPEGEENRARSFVFFASGHLLREIRKSHGRLPKPPGLEEMREEAAEKRKK